MNYDNHLGRSTFFSKYKRGQPSSSLQALADAHFDAARKSQQDALSCFVGNLSYWLALPESERLPEGQFINMTCEKYTLPNSASKNRHIGHKAMHSVMMMLEEEGLITRVKGHKDTHPTIIKPTEKFMTIQFNDEEFTHPLDAEAEENEMHRITMRPTKLGKARVWYDKVEGDIWIREKGNKHKSKIDNDKVEDVKATLDEINNNIVSHRWSFRPETDDVEAAIPITLIESKIGDELIINNNCLFLDRVFNNNEMTWGGRFYCALSNAPRGIRPSLHVNGERVAELDFKSMHILLALAELGIQPDKPDLYNLPSLSPEQNLSWRDLIKSIFLALINLPSWRGWEEACANAYSGQMSKNRRECLLSGETPKVEIPRDVVINELAPIIKAAIEDAYPMLVPYFASNAGVRLMHTDALIMEKILLAAAEEKLPVFGLHDAIFVPESEIEYAKELISWAFQYVTHVELRPWSIKTVVFTKPETPPLAGGYVPKNRYSFAR